MDRFLYRVWDKKKKTMLYSENFFIPKNIINLCTNNKFVVMQCIGLRDSTGSKIYEGDVVIFRQEASIAVGEIIWDNEDAKFWIKTIKKGKQYLSDMEMEIDFDFYDNMGRCFEWNKLIVVGNIYENQKLLEVKDG